MADPLKPSRPEAQGPQTPGSGARVAADDPVRALDLEAVRSLRRAAQREESDLSYLRRVLHGRIDILRAELGRRAAGGASETSVDGRPEPLVQQLSAILSEHRGPARGSRHVPVHPPRTERYRIRVERVLADAELSDPTALDEAELLAAIEDLTGYENEVSTRRLELQREADLCGQEIARRYREGEARVDDLLSGH
ncbi:ABC transporter substrate-binding protein [Yinghuangia sp. ASG 101]|uniref:RsiG family protein n=1 Tax=Yinghuangia sp. ASG 101 TaxID=2896848 RepID=UPI001E3EF550|nr:ABC transporter substrate-binding protein [Yinghuangia sp. ASG 101]UGQ14903.1 ABC transporter substrate-binding protein [Yinghuangia sp. ASG 101]